MNFFSSNFGQIFKGALLPSLAVFGSNLLESYAPQLATPEAKASLVAVIGGLLELSHHLFTKKNK